MRLGLLVLAALLATAAPAAAHPNPNGLPLRFGQAPEQVDGERPHQAAQPRPCRARTAGPGQARDRHPGPRPRRQPRGLHLQHEPRRPPRRLGGGYKALRFTDKAGHECAYYDTTLLFPTNAQTLSERPDRRRRARHDRPREPEADDEPAHARDADPARVAVLNEQRGLLAAVTGNPTVYPGIVDVYDLNEDCRNPVLQSSLPVGLRPRDPASRPTATPSTRPRSRRATSPPSTSPTRSSRRSCDGTNYNSHGLTISDDGNRAYVAASQGLFILDTSEIQARKPGAQFKEVSKLDWPERTIPQVASRSRSAAGPTWPRSTSSRARRTTTARPPTARRSAPRGSSTSPTSAAPKVVSNIRLAVHQRENRAVIADDPGAQSIVQGYAGHYCNVPRRDDPEILACSMIATGLRVFDIRDPRNPREMAYYVAPNKTSRTAGAEQLRDVQPLVRARAQRGLVLGRQLRLLQRQARRLAVRGSERRRRVGRLHGRRRLPLRVGHAAGPPRRLGFTRAARRRREDRGLPGLPGPADRRGAPRRALSAEAATWSGRGPDGYYFARFTMAGRDVRRIVLRKQGGTLHAGGAPLPPRRLRAAALLQARAARVRRPPAHAAAGRLPAHARRARDDHVTRGKRVVARRTADAAPPAAARTGSR